MPDGRTHRTCVLQACLRSTSPPHFTACSSFSARPPRRASIYRSLIHPTHALLTHACFTCRHLLHTYLLALLLAFLTAFVPACVLGSPVLPLTLPLLASSASASSSSALVQNNTWVRLFAELSCVSHPLIRITCSYSYRIFSFSCYPYIALAHS